MKAPKPQKKNPKSRKWLRRILLAFALFILFVSALFTIGWLNRDTVIGVLQDWYQKNNSGTLNIGKVNASFISGFPKVGFTLKDIAQTDTDTILDKFSSVKIEEVKIVIGVGNLLRGLIKFEEIRIKNAVIYSEVISEKPLEYYELLKGNKESKERKGIQMPQWLHEDGVTFKLENVKYIAKDSILNKYFNIDIHKIKGSYKGNELQLIGNLSMDLTVNSLAFNTKNGSYFNGARVTGNPKFTIDLKNDNISVPEFLFRVDKQTFNLSANFDFSGANHYEFKLENPTINFKAIKDLLPDNLVAKIKKYDIQNPFKTNLYLSGKFAYDNSPDIKVNFSTKNNDVKIGNKMHLKNVSFICNLTNDIYKTDSLRIARKSVKDLKIAFNYLNANLDDIEVAIRNAYFQSTPEALNFIEANINLKGSNEALAKLIETDNFDFEGGTFQLNAAISGDIPSSYEFVNKATGNFILQDTRVILKKNGLQLPIQTIDLGLEREHATLRKLIINFPNGEDLVFKGTFKNISGILSKNPKIPTTSNIYLDSKKLNINDFISLSKEFLPKSDKKVDDRKTLHETLDAVYSLFRPSFDINVDALTYNDVTINDLKANIDLVNSETILLRNFDFNYFDAFTSLKGSVVIPETGNKRKETIYINAEATSHGNITVFQKLFNIQLFRFDSGDYQFYGNVIGNVKEFSEILNNAKGNFTLNNTKLYYTPAEMAVDIDSLALFVDNSNMLLKKLNLEIGELYPMNLSGSIKNFPSFLMDNAQNSGAISLKISAPFIDGNRWLTTVNSLKDEEKINKPKNKRALHRLFKDINKFNPEIELAIDSLKYKDLITENLKALVYFENDSILKLKNLDLNYKQTTAKVSGEVNAHKIRLDSLKNPFDLDFLVNVKGKSKDLNDYLKTKNFIFKSGDFEYKGQYKAQSEDLSVFNANGFGDLKISHTLVDYKAAALLIPIDSLHIEVNDDVATLKTLDVDLPGKSSVFFSGSIDHFSNFINNSQDDLVHSSNFSIYSPYIDSADIKEFLANSTSDKEKSTDKEVNLKKLKDAMVGINTSFYPTATVSIDTLRHKAINLTHFGLNLLFDSQGDFKIQDTHLNFYGGAVDMNVTVGITNDNDIPVKIGMQAQAINLHELVTRFDYFNDEALRNTDKIDGNLNLNIETTGTLNNDGKLNMNSLNGVLRLEISDVVLYNYKPIMDNSILMKDERFEKLTFRPIFQTFEIRNGELIIPRTEIQSSAIHLFVEGSLKFNEYVNIWLSLP